MTFDRTNRPAGEAPLTIGQLAELTNCNVPTIRYYEEIGLLPAAQRRTSGHRVYDESAVGLLTFVRQCRYFGFSIEDIRALISLSTNESRDCGEMKEVAQRHLETVRAKLNELAVLEQSLVRFVDACGQTCNGGPAPQCTILKDIVGPAADQRKPSPRCCG